MLRNTIIYEAARHATSMFELKTLAGTSGTPFANSVFQATTSSEFNCLDHTSLGMTETCRVNACMEVIDF